MTIKTMKFPSSGSLWLCLVLLLVSRGGNAAFTVRADKSSFGVSANTLLARGGGGARIATPDRLAVSSNSVDEIQLKDIDRNNRGPLKVLFLSADTGGGHRASAESLAAQFLKHFPGSTYDLVDVWTLDGKYPWSTLVDSYTHLSARPRKWKFLYHFSNFWLTEKMTDWHSNALCGKSIRKRIASYDPDVIVNVHPAMSGAPSYQLAKINKRLGRHIPFYIVVTDMGTAHATWFRSKRADKIYVASEKIKRLAKRRGRFANNRIVMSGLPIRQSFADEAKNLGDRTSEAGKDYQAEVRQSLGIDTDRQMVLVMGGGEGVGGLGKIVDELYVSFMKEGVKASIYVVCGRNEKLKEELATKDWSQVLASAGKTKLSVLRRIFRRKSKDNRVETTASEVTGDVKVVGLGFVTKMAEYMVAADILVSKAGPGTIAEAATLGLPVMMTSYLPGQEAGNVDIVLENDFGAYNDKPIEIAQKVTAWLKDPELCAQMSRRAVAVGRPNAAADIVIDIGTSANAWKVLNGNSKRMTDVEW